MSSMINEALLSTLSEPQLKVLASVNFVVGPLSLLGSSLIIYMIWLRGAKTLHPTYRRLMLGTSCVDVVTSFWTALGPVPVNKEVGALWAFGNVASCSAKGFFLHLSLSGYFYNVSLLLYFLLMIRYRVQEQTYRRIEVGLHVFSWSIVLTAGIVGFFLGVFNPAGPGLQRCFIVGYPPGCEDVVDVNTCTRGKQADTFRKLMVILPLAIMTLAMYTLIFGCYWTVLRQSRRSRSMNIGEAVRTQSLLYSISFFFTYVWTIAYLIAKYGVMQGQEMLENERRLYPVTLLVEIFYPLQGFFNFLIFIRPRLQWIRMLAPPGYTRKQVLQEAIFGTLTIADLRRQRAGSTDFMAAAVAAGDGGSRPLRLLPAPSTLDKQGENNQDDDDKPQLSLPQPSKSESVWEVRPDGIPLDVEDVSMESCSGSTTMFEANQTDDFDT